MNVYIFDFDDTLYPVHALNPSLGLKLKAALLEVNKELHTYSNSQIEEIYSDLKTGPVDVIAAKHGIPEPYFRAIKKTYEELEVVDNVDGFEDATYALNELKGDKYLVTTGYPKLQHSKIEKLNIGSYFKEVMIDIPTAIPRKSKKYYFQYIMDQYTLHSRNFIVVGDNINGEIKYANELNMISVLVDREKVFSKNSIQPHFIVESLYELEGLPTNKWT